MPFIGVQPATVPLTSSDITDGIISTAKIADDAVTGAKIENSPTIANGLTLTDGNIVFANGHGIDFSATANSSGSMSSELLDDYEEGTWSPTASTGLSYGHQEGRYVRIGTLVFASFDIDLDSVSASGNIMGGLPFTVANTEAHFGIVNVGYYSAITTGVHWLSGYTRQNQTSVYFTGNSSSQTTIQHNTFNVFNDTTRILGNLTYHVA